MSEQPSQAPDVRTTSVGGRYKHILRMLLLGDHNVGKTSLLQAFRRKNLGNYRGRRQSLALRPFITVDIELNRRQGNILIKAVDSGGRHFTVIPPHISPFIYYGY